MRCRRDTGTHAGDRGLAEKRCQTMRHPPRRVVFPGKRWAYQIGYWLMTALFTTFPLPQNSGFRESFRFAGTAIDRGYSVLVFPEGHGNDTETGEMDKFQSGVGLLAENLNVPIVPMRIDGVWKMRREGRRIARRGEIVIRIGSSVKFPAGTAPEEIAGRLREIVAGEVPARYGLRASQGPPPTKFVKLVNLWTFKVFRIITFCNVSIPRELRGWISIREWFGRRCLRK